MHSVQFKNFCVFKDRYIIFRINSNSAEFKMYTLKVTMVILRS